jgi:4-carboxymuconolactone decarboxylase
VSEAFEKGIAIFGEVYGDAQADGLRQYLASDTDSFGKLQAQWSMEWAFGTIWTRDELARKMRSCAVLGMTIGLGTADEIKYHTKMGVANGLTKAEIQEIYYTAIPYCGLPKSNLAKAAMIEGFKELEAEGKV